MTELLFLYAFLGYLLSTTVFLVILSLCIEKEYNYMHKYLVEHKQIQDYQDWKLTRRLQLKQLNPIE
jgi:uncharacterized membrane protein YbaN (DUF454 family)